MPRHIQPELLQGTLDLLVLSTLRDGPGHGYGIARAIEQRAGGDLSIEEGSLYPALYRLARRGCLAAEWRAGPSGRRARFYRLTSAGHAELDRQSALWAKLADAVDRVLAGDGSKP